MRRSATRPTLVVAAHGTRDPEGPPVLERLADHIAHAGDVATTVTYVDVIRPTVADTLGEVTGPVVIVPAFLAKGYHVRTDLPRQVSACGRDDVTIAPALGPDPLLVQAMLDRLEEAGRKPDDTLVLAAAGSSDERALADVDTAVAALATATGMPVTAGFVTSAEPTVPEAVAAARRSPHERVAIASWLLAPGLFQQRLTDSGAEVVSEPLGTHPGVVTALLDRYAAAL